MRARRVWVVCQVGRGPACHFTGAKVLLHRSFVAVHRPLVRLALKRRCSDCDQKGEHDQKCCFVHEVLHRHGRARSTLIMAAHKLPRMHLLGVMQNAVGPRISAAEGTQTLSREPGAGRRSATAGCALRMHCGAFRHEGAGQLVMSSERCVLLDPDLANADLMLAALTRRLPLPSRRICPARSLRARLQPRQPTVFWPPRCRLRNTESPAK